METKYKPFDLEKAKAGHPVVTLLGDDVRIICSDRKCEIYTVVALVHLGDNEFIHEYTSDGKYYCDGVESEYDLAMKPVKTTYWLNVYKSPTGQLFSYCSEFFSSEELARENHEQMKNSRSSYVTTVSFEIEE